MAPTRRPETNPHRASAPRPPTAAGCRGGRAHAAQEVIAHIRGLIETGALKPGDRLPSERDLVGRLGVSRPSIAEGMRLLSALGIVRCRRSRTLVSIPGPFASEPLAVLAALHGMSGQELFEARRIIEVGAAGLAAQHATPDQIAEIADVLAETGPGLEDARCFDEHDSGFHRAVVAAAGNAALALLADTVLALQRQVPCPAVERDCGSRRRVIDVHRRIYRAIRARNAVAAHAAMQEHLSRPEDAPGGLVVQQ